MKKEAIKIPEFLKDLLDARSPSGYEGEAQKVVDRYLKPVAERYEIDALGQRMASINGDGDPVLMLAGHMDELGLIITYIDDGGFLYFDTIGGHDRVMIPGRRVVIQTRNGPIKGVTGKRAIHLMDLEERKKAPKLDELWIDIGVTGKTEATSLVRIGDVATYDHGFELIRGSVGVARAFDNACGAYVVGETLRRLSKEKSLRANVVSVATTQEEVGCRGALTSAFAIKPQVGIAVDVGHATDHPDCSKKKFGDFKLGGGPIVTRGSNINPLVCERILQVAENEGIAIQLEADPRPTGTDGRSIQISRGGVATGVLSVPLRYMHTPSEIVDLEDVENTVKLLTSFALSLQKGESFVW